MTEDEMAGWHHRLDGHESEQAPGAGDGQGGLACCGPRGLKESETTERLCFHFSLSCIGEKRQPTPVFLPGESQGQGSLVGCRLWGRTESDMPEAT